MKHKFILSILLLIILSLSAFASEQYLMPGISRDSSYQQDGSGLWTGRTPTEYTRAYTNLQSYFPGVADVDNDGHNEIIIIADDNLVILNYTTGVGLVQEQSISHGTTNISTSLYRVTPALFDTDSTGAYEIISWNTTHVMMYSWNGTSIVLNQSKATNFNTTVSQKQTFFAPTIKCAQASQFSTDKDTCVFAASNRSGVTEAPVFTAYNLDDNTVTSTEMASVGNVDGTFHNTHLADGDGDGFLEAYFAYNDLPNGDLYIYKAEIATQITASLLYTHSQAINRPHTDIVVNNLYGDGGVLDISFGYSGDGTNFDAATINANTGAVLDASYCSVLTCPEGDVISANMVVSDDTTYCDFSGDVYYYIRNYEESDPGIDIDTIFCISQYAGAGTQETEIVNTVNFTGLPLIHQASLHGSTGVLTPKFTLQGSTKQSKPLLNELIMIPVDYQESGTLDLMGLSSTTLRYYDDGYTNQQYQILSLSVDTGNPVCQNELVKFTVELFDNESNVGNCTLEELWFNSTLKSSPDNETINPYTTSASMDYYADEVGTFNMRISCTDQYHTTPTRKTYSTTVSNNTLTCNLKGEDPYTEDFYVDEQLSQELEWEEATESFWDGLGAESKKARNALALIIALLIVVGIYLKTKSVSIAIASLPVSLLIFFFIGLASIFPVVITIIFTIAVLVYFVMSGRTNGV